MVNKYYLTQVNKYYKNTKKDSEWSMWNIKIFWKKKKTKGEKKARERYQNLTEEEKEERHQYYQERKQKLPK